MRLLQQIEQNEYELSRNRRDNRYLKIGLFVMTVAVVALLFGRVARRRKKLPEAKSIRKYAGSTLDVPAKQKLKDKIQEILANGDEIYAADFNLERLAALCNSNPKYVSQVINELYESNFSLLLSRYRIEEARRRIEHSDFSNLTLEAIATSVGFKSRATFHAAFKRFMWQTPGEYIKNVKGKCPDS